MFLLVGLGNPGAKYKDNRHNIGFKAVLEIQSRFNFSEFTNKYQGLYSTGTIAGHKVHLLMPQTYMNKSGHSVAELARFFRIEPKNIIVFHDELDIDPLKVKMKIGGGEGGHNGLKSITSCIGSKDYCRIRLGIGHPGDKNLVANYVLKDFPKDQASEYEHILYSVSKIMPTLLNEGIGKASNELALSL
jgi:peptidyl-tRNA hydrolase, PTH1 family